MLSGIDLGHNFSEKQQQEGQQHRHAQELQPPGTAKVDEVVKEVAEEHNDGDVHQIVGD